MKKYVILFLVALIITPFALMSCDRLSLDDPKVSKLQEQIDQLNKDLIAAQEKNRLLVQANTRLQAEKEGLQTVSKEWLELYLNAEDALDECLNKKSDTIKKRPLTPSKDEPLDFSKYSVMKWTVELDSGKLYNKPAMEKVAKEVVAYAKAYGNKNVKITVKGYSSHDGDADYNLWLSKERAEGVAFKIFSLGNDNNDMNVAIKYFGETSDDARKVVVTAEVIN